MSRVQRQLRARGELRGGGLGYPSEQLFEEVAYIAYHFHWSPEQILSLKGSAERGRDLFFKSAGLQCVNCHRINGTGSTLGPDLSQVARKATRGQLLESLLEPSKTIEPQYTAYLLETTDGKVYTGLLGSRTDKEVVLKVVGDKEVRVPAARVERLAPQPKSLMQCSILPPTEQAL